ncbi:hypothetical protein GEV29_13200 [Aeromicrobium sp. SMF47]|uniref:Uncharacterized protein n=1 Tax=Aeromicrobium yanjiei TaxID=2662028 RepID=A0A5Q2MIA0_9ACTN|nr:MULTISPECIES: hypothetical protein [Aeromicrobium]MRJ77498.1 hypothetical protein [Aeromicrobium yanjiei]MRK01865.1 hypothetical protein [Aeromicrobium sp. S22]QGG41393.1 hypothetical protein GEV26_08485 [Aeromicrobium yanjiei]
MDAVTHRLKIADLAGRLISEFEGILVPGQVMRLVYQADRLVLRSASSTDDPVVLCEQIARRLLDDRVVHEARRRTVA